MVRLPDFQMNYGDNGILNLTYRLDATKDLWFYQLNSEFARNPN